MGDPVLNSLVPYDNNSKITIGWTLYGSQFTWIKVWKNEDGGTWGVAKTFTEDREAWDDGSVTTGVKYGYKIQVNPLVLPGDGYSNILYLTLAAAQENNAVLDIDLCERVQVSVPYESEQRDFLGTYGISADLHRDYTADGQKVFMSQWTSKDLDFTEQFEQYRNHYFTVEQVILEYVDLSSSTPTTVHLSNDGGVTWNTSTLSLGNGDGTQKVAVFWFQRGDAASCTGKKFMLRLSSSSTSTKFAWTGISVVFYPRGKYQEVS